MLAFSFSDRVMTFSSDLELECVLPRDHSDASRGEGQSLSIPSAKLQPGAGVSIVPTHARQEVVRSHRPMQALVRNGR